MPFADVAALALPAHATVAPVAATPWETVTVRPGDTLWDLADRRTARRSRRSSRRTSSAAAAP